ncbi:MAG: nitroreductase, partial [Candidatus Korarchaeum sp.]
MRYPGPAESSAISLMFLTLTLSILLLTGAVSLREVGKGREALNRVDLPEPKLRGEMSVEEAISKRRSI